MKWLAQFAHPHLQLN